MMSIHQQPQKNPNCFAKQAARTALATNNNIQNLQHEYVASNKIYPTNHKNSNKIQQHNQETYTSMIQPIALITRKQQEQQPQLHHHQQQHHRPAPSIPAPQQKPSELDRIVESVENATKRLSQISTNTNSSKRKSKNHVGPWRLGRTLGRGSSGRVRLAKHSETGQLAAVKIVPKAKFQKHEGETTKDGLSPLGIEREIIIMKLISHQNIMALYDVWENKGELYLVLEYVEGGELFDYLIKKGKLQEKEAIRYFRQIISGVSYCHQFNICHRDLKPENLLLDRGQNIKIADFGMAALEMNQKLLETSCGSPHYASPEIVSGKTYHGSPSDVWSCGIILFALLTGHLPFDDENIKTLLMKVQTGKFVMPEYISAEAKDLICKMLVVNPTDRIKIFDILKHPLLKKYETVTTLKSCRNDKTKISQYYNKVEQMVLTNDDIDKDILKSLSILFHGMTDAQLIPRLLSDSSNPEKIFYYLLQDYKKDHHAAQSKLKKEKSSTGDGLLKKSKSTAKTIITNLEDGYTTTKTTIIPTDKQTAPLPITSSSSSKRIIRDNQGKLQIPASSSSRRGVSLNSKQIATITSNQGQGLSRSSSKKSVAGVRTNPNILMMNPTATLPSVPTLNDTTSNALSASTGEVSDIAIKKRMSLLPQLTSLDLSLGADSNWLDLDSEQKKDLKLDNNEFASIYKDIFKSLKTPSPSPRRSQKRESIQIPRRSSLRDHVYSTMRGNSSPLKHGVHVRGDDEDDEKKDIINKGDVSLQRESTVIYTPLKQPSSQIRSSGTKLNLNAGLNTEEIQPPPSMKLLSQSTPQSIQLQTEKARPKPQITRTVSKPAALTLDPKHRPRRISENNAKVLNKFGVNIVENRKSLSRFDQLKSSTSLNLNVILENKAAETTEEKTNQYRRLPISQEHCQYSSSKEKKVSSATLLVPPQSKATDVLSLLTPNEPPFRIASSVYSFESSHHSQQVIQSQGPVESSNVSARSSRYSNGTINNDAATYSEIPDTTSIAKLIHVSNGSNVTVFKTSLKSPVIVQGEFTELRETLEGDVKKEGTLSETYDNDTNEMKASGKFDHLVFVPGQENIHQVTRMSVFQGQDDEDEDEEDAPFRRFSQIDDAIDTSQSTVLHHPYQPDTDVLEETAEAEEGEGFSEENSSSENYADAKRISLTDHDLTLPEHTKRDDSFDDDDFEDVDDDEEEDEGESFGDIQEHKVPAMTNDNITNEVADGGAVSALDVKKYRTSKAAKAKSQNDEKQNNVKVSSASGSSNGTTIKKSNWFARFLSSLSTSSSSSSQKKSTASEQEKRGTTAKQRPTKTFYSRIPLIILKKAIKSTLLLKQQEGVVQNYHEISADRVTARVPVHGFFGTNMLIFEICYDFEANSLQSIKIKGPKKWFERVTKEIGFVVRYETQRYEEQK